jgi:hypothetical protein
LARRRKKVVGVATSQFVAFYPVKKGCVCSDRVAFQKIFETKKRIVGLTSPFDSERKILKSLELKSFTPNVLRS